MNASGAQQGDDGQAGRRRKAADYRGILEAGDVATAYRGIRCKKPDARGCCEHALAATKRSNKYAQVRFKGVKYYCHIIACMLGCGRAPEPGEEASHICGNPRCIT